MLQANFTWDLCLQQQSLEMGGLFRSPFQSIIQAGRGIMEPAQDATDSNMNELASALTAYHRALLSLSPE